VPSAGIIWRLPTPGRRDPHTARLADFLRDCPDPATWPPQRRVFRCQEAALPNLRVENNHARVGLAIGDLKLIAHSMSIVSVAWWRRWTLSSLPRRPWAGRQLLVLHACLLVCLCRTRACLDYPSDLLIQKIEQKQRTLGVAVAEIALLVLTDRVDPNELV
jgi:hypothetical protein